MEKKNIFLYICFVSLLSFLTVSCGGSDSDPDPTPALVFEITSVSIDSKTDATNLTDINPTGVLKLMFSDKIDTRTIDTNIALTKGGQKVDISCIYDEEKAIEIKPAGALMSFTTYQLTVYPNMKSATGNKINTGKVYSFTTSMDTSDKFDRISDEELLDLVQKNSFKYFWNFGHPTSGMARERTTSGNIVTTGGTGFGVMAMLVAAERGFITRGDALKRIQTIVTFLDEKCTKYHGAYAHWINGETGQTQPFSTKDNGADLVETALLFEGLLTAKAYFEKNSADEILLRNNIQRLYEAIEWTWFQKNNENQLYWHWSEDHGWGMNLAIQGWNESLIVYVLAASSPTFPISKEVYDNGWTRNGNMVNGNTYYGYKLPLGTESGGPLFLSHYSFLGINPNGLKDKYTDYLEQNKNHTLINRGYCIANPKGYMGYSADCWGLTACDGDTGYSAHSPTNDRGVIAPTAALSSMAYTPKESMQALHFFYYKLGDKLWGDYGFYDAFNISKNWFDNQHIAIDQGPIIIMIENHRTGLIWNKFMSLPEIKQGLTKLGFSSPKI